MGPSLGSIFFLVHIQNFLYKNVGLDKISSLILSSKYTSQKLKNTRAFLPKLEFDGFGFDPFLTVTEKSRARADFLARTRSSQS